MLVITVGGLGVSQMSDIERRFQSDPRNLVMPAGGFNGYKASLSAILAAMPNLPAAIIAHSFAAMPSIDVLSTCPGRVIYLALIDPVSCIPFVSKCTLPATHPRFYWARRTGAGVEVMLDIDGAGLPEYVKGSHNSLPRDAKVIDRLAADVESLHRST